MCGRFTLFVTPDELEERFGVEVPAEWTPSYNVAPGQEIATVADGVVRLRRWGLVPAWADEPDESGHINARAESIEEKPSFRTAVTRRRCLVPADGFYEWTDTDGGRRPHRIAFEDGRTFAMAGIWERWEGRRSQTGLEDFVGGDAEPDVEVSETVAILTTEARAPVEDLHDRMPVLLPASREADWLTASASEERAAICSDPATDGLRTHPVSTAVNDPSRDAPELIEPIDGEALGG